jgi:hypothetical protein
MSGFLRKRFGPREIPGKRLLPLVLGQGVEDIGNNRSV